MKREEFVSMFSQNRIRESYKKFFKMSTWEMDVFRFNLPYKFFTERITITPESTYIPNSVVRRLIPMRLTLEEYMDFLTKDFESEYMMQGDITFPFDYNGLATRLKIESLKLEKDKNNNFGTFVVPTKPMWYLRSVLLSNHSRFDSLLRFLPLKAEKGILMYYLKNYGPIRGNGDTLKSEEDIDLSLKDNESFQQDISHYYNKVFVSSKNYVNKERATLNSDYKSLLDEKIGKELSFQKFDYWLRSRHDIFGQVCLKLLGEDFLDELDVNIETRFNYMGPDFYKTPDYIYETKDKVLIIDFAVTTGSAGEVRERKINKYSELALGLKKHLNKEVECEAIVWKINNMEDIQIPSQFSEINLRENLMLHEALDYLHKLHLQISLMDNYEKFRVMSEEEDLEENQDASLKLQLLKKMNTSIIRMSPNFKNLQSKDFDSYRKRERGKKVSFKKLEDLEFKKELDVMSQMMEGHYMNSVVDLLGMKVEKSDYPEHLMSVLEKDYNNIDKVITKEWNKQMIIRNEFVKNINFKFPQLFKFPLFHENDVSKTNYFCNKNPDFYGAVRETTDGTLFYSHTFDFFEQKLREKKKKELPYNKLGLGTDYEMDKGFIDSILEMMKETSILFESKFLLEERQHMDEPLKMFLKTQAWAILETTSDMFLNLAYLEGRRHIFDQSKGHTVLKNFGSYYLLIKKGSKLTSQKAIRYKVIMHESCPLTGSSELFHKMKASDQHTKHVETGWLSATITDIRHFAKLKEVAFAMASNYYDKLREMHRGSDRYHDIIDNVLMTYMLILLEHKRGTSTTLQLNRYLMHSATSYISNNESLIKDIFKAPTRSILESYIKAMQMKWYDMMLRKSDEFSYKRVVNMNSTSNSYDRFNLPSMFDTSKEIEFSLVMDEIYMGNLFDKEAGFDSHRVKSIVEKMETEEMHFHKINQDPIKSKWSMGMVDDLNEFISSRDETHMFDRAFVTMASKRFFDSKVNKIKLQEALMIALRSTIEPAMMMTASLIGGPYESECLEFSENIQKTKTFLSLYNMIKKMSSHMLIEMCNNMDKVDAVFAMFPKSQIGGPREILIQAVMLRVLVKFLETISKKFCSVHEKEMLTKDRVKAELQSDKMAEFRETIRSLNAKDKTSLYFSLNTDASRWAPGFVMEHFMYFVNEWDLDEELKTLLLVIVSSFSSKTMLVPEILKRKWENKDLSDKDFLEGVQSFREQAVSNNYKVEIMSGMGQGMFHYLSSFYHAVMDDCIMDVTKKVLHNKRGVIIKDVTMLSSDDKTRMVLMLFKSGPDMSDRVLKDYIYLQDTLSRMCNIHFNWKKSGMNFAITEFNSLFSIGKRMTWASIKDIYTSNSIPDLTAPEEAVNFMISNIRRCLEHGVYLTTIKWMMLMAREQLKRYYRYDESIVKRLTTILNCKESSLPFQLGFFPTTMEVETLIYGPEIHMYKLDNSPELELFYDNVYKANVMTGGIKSKKVVPFSEDSKGKFWLELPSRLDKQLKELKKDFYTHELAESPDDVMIMANKMSMNINAYNTDPKTNHDFTNNYFIGMNRKYEFQETMVVHSLIRALGMTNGKARIYPQSQTEMEIVEEIRNKKKMLDPIYKGKVNKVKVLSEINVLEDSYNRLGTDVVDFTMKMMVLDSTGMAPTARKLYDGLKSIVDNYNKIILKLNTMSRSTNYLHPTMKAIRFYTCRVGSNTKPEDLINHLFDVKKNSSNSAAAMMEDLMSLAGVKKKHMATHYNNPFKFVKNFMNNSDYPFKAFYDFIKLNYKSMKYVKITMLTDFLDAGNMEENLLNVYRTKSTPTHYYRYSAFGEKSDDNALEFLTNFSMGNYEFNRLNYEEASQISQKDTTLIRAMKMNYFNVKDKDNDKTRGYTNSEEIISTRFDYKTWKEKGSPSKNYAWNNLNMIIVATERVGNRIDVMAYANSMIKENNSCNYMLSMFARFMAEKVRDGWNFNFRTKGNYHEDYEVFYDRRDVYYKMVVRYYSTKWTMSYNIQVMNSRNFWVQGNMNLEFPLLIDNYTVESNYFMNYKLINPDDPEYRITIKEVIDENPGILALDRIIMENGLLSNLELVENEAPDEDTKYTLEAMNEAFGNENIGNMLFNLGLNPREKAFKTVNSDTEDSDGESKSKSSESVTEINLESLFNQEGGLKGLKEAIELASMNKHQEEEEAPNNWQRTSRIKILDYMVTHAVKQELSVNKEELVSFYHETRRTEKTASFHNMIFFQIMEAFDFEISDNMSVMIYNVILKNYVPMTLVHPSSRLKKFSPDMKEKMTSTKRFIEHKHSANRVSLEEDLDLFS